MTTEEFIKKSEEKVYALPSRMLVDGMYNSAIPPPLHPELRDKNQIQLQLELTIDKGGQALLEKLLRTTSVDSQRPIILRGAYTVTGEKSAHPQYADLPSILMPMFINHTLKIKEEFQSLRFLNPQHQSLVTGIGSFVNVVTQYDFPMNPTTPNYDKPVIEESTVLSKIPSANEVDTFEVSSYWGFQYELYNARTGSHHKCVLLGPEPYISTKVQLLHDRKFIVLTECATHTKNVLHFDGTDIRDWSISLFKGPKAVEGPALDLLIGQPGDMTSVLGITAHLDEFSRIFLEPNFYPATETNARHELENKHGFKGIETIGQL